MNVLHTRCLDTFPEWLRSLAADASELAQILEADYSDDAKLHVAASLNYLFKSLDLIPDGIEDLGFLDDAFVLRVGAKEALGAIPEGKPAVLTRLAEDTDLISELLGKDYGRLVAYTKNLVHGAARGRSTEEIVKDQAVRSAFVAEVASWSAGYVAPSFSRDEKNIVKLASFLSHKLPA